MLGHIGLTDALLVLGALIVMFGAKRIPGIGRALGQGISNFIGEIRGQSRSSAELPTLGSSAARKPEPPLQ